MVCTVVEKAEIGTGGGAEGAAAANCLCESADSKAYRKQYSAAQYSSQNRTVHSTINWGDELLRRKSSDFSCRLSQSNSIITVLYSFTLYSMVTR